MKKSFIIAAIALVCGTMAYAQPRAIGGRLGWNEAFVYQHTLTDKTFIEANVGVFGVGYDTKANVFSGGIHVDFIHEWIWLTPNWTERGEWNWFAGVGANVGWKWSDPHYVRDMTGSGLSATYISRPLVVGAIANIGLEYTFWFPLSLAVDYRPTLGAAFGQNAGSIITSSGVSSARFYTDGLFDIAISVRYRFGMRD